MSFGAASLGSQSFSVAAEAAGIVPLLQVFSSSSTNFRAGSSFRLDSASTVAAHHPQRYYDIASTATTVFVTNQRAFSIESTSTPTFRYGAQIHFDGGSTLDFNIRIPRLGDYAINSNSVMAGATQWQHDTAFNSSSASRFYPGRGYIRDIRFVVRTDSKPEFRGAQTSGLPLAVNTRSTLNFRAEAVRHSAFSVVSGSAVQVSPAYRVSFGMVIPCSTDVAFVGLQSVQSAVGIASDTAAEFVSAYSYSPVLDVQADMDVFFVQKKHRAFVVTP